MKEFGIRSGMVLDTIPVDLNLCKCAISCSKCSLCTKISIDPSNNISIYCRDRILTLPYKEILSYAEKCKDYIENFIVIY